VIAVSSTTRAGRHHVVTVLPVSTWWSGRSGELGALWLVAATANWVNLVVGSFECHCRPGYYGATCDHVDGCASNPCQNGASCSNTSSTGSYQCVLFDIFGLFEWVKACHVPLEGKLVIMETLFHDVLANTEDFDISATSSLFYSINPPQSFQIQLSSSCASHIAFLC